MRIALDFDGTYTADIPMWNEILAVMSAHGHEVVCVTSRRDIFVNHEAVEASGINIPIVYCNYNAKAEVMRKLGQPVDVWIDDHPHAIDPDGTEPCCQGFEFWKESGE